MFPTSFWLALSRSHGLSNSYGSPLGHPTSAAQVTVGRYDDTRDAWNDSSGNYNLFFALNDDRSLFRSHTGDDSSWQYVGNPFSASRVVAASGTLGERLFALNDDGGIYFNYGDGCDDHWIYLGPELNYYGNPVGGSSATGGSGGTDACAGRKADCSYCCDPSDPAATDTPMRSFSLAMYGCACSGCYSACSASLCDSNTPQPSNGCLACIKANLGGADCTTGWQTCKASALCGPYGACVLGCL